MSISISRVQAPPTIDSQPVASKQGKSSEFSSVLEGAIEQVERSRENAADSIRRMLGGEKDELHETVLATQKAELQFEMFLQVRNKVVSAYQEVMKMQV
jgi:flagellar hook-basal body complex protein FliE